MIIIKNIEREIIINNKKFRIIAKSEEEIDYRISLLEESLNFEPIIDEQIEE